MKKMAVFVMAMALACTSSPADLHMGAATETVYAAQAVAISSEEDLVAMQENPDGNYYLAKDITINGNLNLFPNYYDYDTKVQHEECFTRSASRVPWMAKDIRLRTIREWDCSTMQKMQRLKTLL